LPISPGSPCARPSRTQWLQVRGQLGKEYPLIIGGQEVRTADKLPSVNPAKPSEVIGTICQASTKEIDLAIEAAKKAAPAWKALSPEERAGYLLKAADIARKEIYDPVRLADPGSGQAVRPGPGRRG
jgi:delta 1-pyrroline-5-carboxylate dehydrogenase